MNKYFDRGKQGRPHFKAKADTLLYLCDNIKGKDINDIQEYLREKYGGFRAMTPIRKHLEYLLHKGLIGNKEEKQGKLIWYVKHESFFEVLEFLRKKGKDKDLILTQYFAECFFGYFDTIIKDSFEYIGEELSKPPTNDEEKRLLEIICFLSPTAFNMLINTKRNLWYYSSTLASFIPHFDSKCAFENLLQLFSITIEPNKFSKVTKILLCALICDYMQYIETQMLVDVLVNPKRIEEVSKDKSYREILKKAQEEASQLRRTYE